MTEIAQICAQHGDDPSALLEILHDVQATLGHVPEDALPDIARRLNISRAEAHGVMSFYHDFRRDPARGVVVKICRAEACQAMGAEALWTRIARRSGITVEPVYCLGNCALAPAAMVAGQLIGRADDARLTTAIAEAGA
ncbi:MAG: NAD(P)H-dependent oxidoreductase subunit E [Pseudomonadota bacterium]